MVDCHERAASRRKSSKESVHSTSRLRVIRHSSDSDTRHRELSEGHDEIELALIGTERNEIDQLFRKGLLNGEARRRIERDLDLREAQLLNDRRI